jgi:CBS domain-containing protein
LDNPLEWEPDLDAALDRNPLIVSPETPLVTAIAIISQTHHRFGRLDEVAPVTRTETVSTPARHTGCVLIIAQGILKGILTERDVVRLTASGTDLTQAIVSEVMVQPVITLPQRSLRDVFAALFMFRRYHIRHLPIVDDSGGVVGVISQTSLRQALRPANLLRLRRVADVMTSQVIQASLSTPVLQLAKLMVDYQVSCVVITQTDAEGNSRPVGIVTERDIVQFQTLQIDLHQTPARTVMSTPLFLLSPEDSLWVAHQEMQKRRVGRLVVSWNWWQKMGIITESSLLQVFDPVEMYGVIQSLQQTLQQMNQSKDVTASPLRTDRQIDSAIANTLDVLECVLQQPNLETAAVQADLQSLKQQLQAVIET